MVNYKVTRSRLKTIFDRGFVSDEDDDILYELCEIVYRSHFLDKFNLKDELIQEGVLGIIRVVDSGSYKEGNGDIYDFAYTCVRNSMANFIYYEPNERNGEDIVGLNYNESIDSGFDVPPDLVDEMTMFIKNKVDEYIDDPKFKYYVFSYFKDKLGIKYQVKPISDFSIDFVDKYRYYVNYIEFQLFEKYLNSRVFENKIDDLLDILEGDQDIDFYTRMFISLLERKQLAKLLYIFSGNGFKFPSKYRLLKIDSYLSIYKRIEFGGMSFEEAVKFFDKPLTTIINIYSKYSDIFKDED